MPELVGAAAVLLVMVGAAACSSSGGRPIVATADPVTSTAAAAHGGAVHSLPPGASGNSIPWTLRGISDHGRVLDISFSVGSPGCYALRGADLAQNAKSVEITVLVRRVGDHSACADDAIGHNAYVTLAAPLGDRRLLHAPVSGS